MVWIFVVPEKSVAKVRLKVCRSAWNVPPARFAVRCTWRSKCWSGLPSRFGKISLQPGFCLCRSAIAAIRSGELGCGGCASVLDASQDVAYPRYSGNHLSRRRILREQPLRRERRS